MTKFREQIELSLKRNQCRRAHLEEEALCQLGAGFAAASKGMNDVRDRHWQAANELSELKEALGACNMALWEMLEEAPSLEAGHTAITTMPWLNNPRTRACR